MVRNQNTQLPNFWTLPLTQGVGNPPSFASTRKRSLSSSLQLWDWDSYSSFLTRVRSLPRLNSSPSYQAINNSCKPVSLPLRTSSTRDLGIWALTQTTEVAFRLESLSLYMLTPRPCYLSWSCTSAIWTTSTYSIRSASSLLTASGLTTSQINPQKSLHSLHLLKWQKDHLSSLNLVRANLIQRSHLS